MAKSISSTKDTSATIDHWMPNMRHVFTSAFTCAMRAIQTIAKAMIFFLKVFPMLPSQPIDWMTKTPEIEKVRYPRVLVRLKVISTGHLHPVHTLASWCALVLFLLASIIPRSRSWGTRWPRAGFVALLYWSPSMRDFRLNPEDVENIALAYKWLVEQPYVDPARSGLLGTCVGGSFALMAAATPLIRDSVAFIAAYAPYSSMDTFVRDIASATRDCGDGREPWQVDPLTRKVFVHSLTAWLEPSEAKWLRSACVNGNGNLGGQDLSIDGQAVCSLLTARDKDEAESALQHFPATMQDHLATLSPMNYLMEIRAPLIILLHDRGDLVIPVSESRCLRFALAGHPELHYTEMEFQHLDPVKGKLPLFRLLQELGKFFVAVYPMFRQAVAS